MKKLSIYILFTAFTFSAFAQIDRTNPPKPGPAPQINLKKAASFELKNGLKVYVVENRKLPRVAFSLTLDRDPVLEGDKVGYLGITGQLMRNGTASKSKEQLDEEIDFIGASVSTFATGMFATSLSKHRDKLLELMTDVLYNPAFPESELEKIRKQTLSGLAASKENPSAIANNVENVLLYGKEHPYGEVSTEETVQAITLEDCKAYYGKYFKPNIAHLAIVGDITLKDAKKLAKKYFASWERGEVEAVSYKNPTEPSATYVAMVDRPSSVQSVIQVSYPVPLKIGSPDVVKTRVLNQILGAGFSSRLMQNLREDKAFTYGARSSMSSDRLVGQFTASASVRNDVTDSAVYEFLYELKRIVDDDVTENELKAAKASISGSFARALEQPQTVANYAINTAIYNLPENYYSDYLQNIEAVTIADVKATAAKYIRPENAHVIVVGKAGDVADKLKRFGEVKYFDNYANPVDPAKAKLPSGLTAEKVIEDYVQALGGKEKLASIKDVSIKMSGELQGQKLEITQILAQGKKFKQTMQMGTLAVGEIKTDGSKAEVSQMGRKLPLDEAINEEQILTNALFGEALLVESGAKLTLDRVEVVEGKDAYVIEVELSKGSNYTLYFDVESGLKVKYAKVIKTPQGEFSQAVAYGDYKEVEGVKFPYLITQNIGPQVIKMTATEVKVNTEVSDDTFNVN